MFLLAFLFVIGILVFVHELGHFLVAKWQGVRVEKFSLGFGKKLIGFTRGDTEYLICALPLGGYVKMYGEGSESIIIDKVKDGSNAQRGGFCSGDRIVKAGEIDLKSISTWSQLLFKINGIPDEKCSIELERDGNTVSIQANAEDLDGITGYTEKEYPRGFSNKSILSRFLIVMAGPMMNFVLPFFFLPLAFMIGIQVPSYLEKAPVIGYVSPSSSADRSGFEIDDEIISVNGKAVKDWREVIIAFHSNPDSILSVEVERNNEIKNLNLKVLAAEDILTSVGLSEPIPAKVGSVNPGFPAQKSGLQRGDLIIKIDNKNIKGWTNMSEVIEKKAGEQVLITVDRQGETLEFKLTPEVNPQTNRGVIGITLYREQITKKYGIFESVTNGVFKAVNMLEEVTVGFFGFLFKLFTGGISLSTAGNSVAGPLFIAKLSGSVAQIGFGQLLQFISFISINLAIINLLPIPVLDGGHILFLLLEKIKGRSLSNKTLEITQRVGFSLLIFIMLLATYKDFMRLKGDIFAWFDRLIQIF